MPPLFVIRLAPQKLQTEMVSQDFRCQLEGYGLTAANIMYRRPDCPGFFFVTVKFKQNFREPVALR